MTANSVRHQRILRACELLFGPDVRVNESFIGYLQPGGVKAAFRKRVKELHPDLRRGSSDDFIRIKSAHDDIVEYLENLLPPKTHAFRDLRNTQTDSNESEPRATGGAFRSKNSAGRPPFTEQAGDGKGSVKRYRGKVPACSLRFGQYCYYRGLISWNTLIEAVCWQRSRRPNFGSIAMDMGFLDRDQLGELIRIKRQGEYLGDSALRTGIMEDRDVRRVLNYQRRFQMPIGRYFLDMGIFRNDQMADLLRKHTAHNRRYARPIAEPL